MEFAEYSLDVFHKQSASIVDELLRLHSPLVVSVTISKPYKVCSGFGFEWHYVQGAKIAVKAESGVAFIAVNWQLQDDGWEPYAVAQVTCRGLEAPANTFPYITTEVSGIYPKDIPKLNKIILTLLENG